MADEQQRTAHHRDQAKLCLDVAERVSIHRARLRPNGMPMWQPIATAPFDLDLALAVIDTDGPHALIFACRRALRGWIKAEDGEKIEVWPTHWRAWTQSRSSASRFDRIRMRSRFVCLLAFSTENRCPLFRKML